MENVLNYFLVIVLNGLPPAIVPVPYETIDSCKLAARGFYMEELSGDLSTLIPQGVFLCIPSPKDFTR